MNFKFPFTVAGIIALVSLFLFAYTANAQTGYELQFVKANSQYITVPHSSSLNLTTTFTMEAFVNTPGGINNTIIDKGNYDYLWQLNANGNGNKMGFFLRQTQTMVYSTADVPQYIPSHVAVTLSGGTLTFYINGVASGTAAMTISQDALPMNIGRQQPSSCQCSHFNGTMDEVRIWNVARTQAQIQANMQIPVAPNSAGLVAYYKFDEGSGTTTADATANGNNGTLVNSPTWLTSSLQYNTPGSFQYTVPAGVQSIRVQLWGAGAAGSNCDNGRSGGGGVFVQSKTLPVTPGQVYTVRPGYGGSTSNAGGEESYIMLNGNKIIGAYGGAVGFGQGGLFGAANAEYSHKGGDAGSNYQYVDQGGYSILFYGGGGACGGTTGPGGNGMNATSSGQGYGAGGQPSGTGGSGGQGASQVNCGQLTNTPRAGGFPGGGGGGPFHSAQFSSGGNGKIVISQCYAPGSIVGHTMPLPYELSVDSVYDATGAPSGASYIWQQSTNNSTWTTAPGNVTTRAYPLQVANPPNEMYYRRNTVGCGLSSNSVVVKVFSQANEKLNGTISGRVTSTNGSGVSGITITAQKTAALLGSPISKLYTTITDNGGYYQLTNIFYGDVSNGDPSPVTFTVTPSKTGHTFSAASTIPLSSTNPNPTNLPQNFTDYTVYAVNGTITQNCVGCMTGFTTDNLDSVKLTATKLPGTNPTAQSYSGGNGHGKYGVTLTDPGNYKITPSYFNQTFTPVESTVSIVNNDVNDIDFTNTTVRTISGVFKAGGNQIIGTAVLEFTDTIINKPVKFKKQVTTAADGSYSISLPARTYKVRVLTFTPNAAGSDIPPNDLYTFFNVITKDSSIRNIDTANKILDLIYHRPPVLQIVNLPDTSCGPYVVFKQGRLRSFSVNIWEGDPIHNYKLPSVAADSFRLTLVTSVHADDIPDSLRFPILNGVSNLSLMPGYPNIVAPYRKMFNLTFKDRYGRAATPINRNVVVLGVKSNPGTFTTVSPEIPFLILHDPPGDNSFSFWQRDSTSESAISFSTLKNNSYNAWLQAKLGVSLILGLGVSYEASFWASINANMGVSATINEANQAIVSVTNSQYFSTADNSVITGDAGDVYVGAALNLLYAKAYEIKYISNCALGLDSSLMIAENGFATKYVYSESHIVNNVIPTLQNFVNNTSGSQKASYENQVNVWRQVVANNAANKLRAAFDKNISFDGTAGAQTEYTTASSTKSSTIEFNLEVNTQLAIELGLEISGSGISGGVNIGFKMETGESKTTTATRSTTIGYTIDDDDDGDYFSVDVKKDPVYGTPVFALVAGTASCPDEPIAQKRDQAQLLIPVPAKYNIPANAEEPFELHISNTSESGEERTYLLNFDIGSNPNSASVTIGGFPVSQVPLTIPFLGTQVVTVYVKKNQFSNVFSYEGLKFTVTDACGGSLSKSATISAHFTSPCSNIALSAPVNWRVNGSSNNSLAVSFDSYTIPNLTSIALEHAAAGSSVWFTDTTVFSGQMNNPLTTPVIWNTTNVPDGSYDLRAKLVCANGTVYSQRIPGIVDRTPPIVFGAPDPTDDNYVAGDIISYSYNENIDNTNLAGKIELRRMSNNAVVPVNASGYQNKIVVVPSTSISGFTNDTLRLIMTGITDVNGNAKPQPDTSYFAVGLTLPGSGSTVLNLSSNRRTMLENAFDSLEVRFTLPQPAANNTSVNYTIHGTATYGTDYTVRYPNGQPASTSFNGTQGTITILKNATTAVLRIKPVAETLFEPNETITVSVAEGGNYVLGSVQSITDTIRNDDHTPPVVFKSGPTNMCAGQSLTLSTNNTIDGQPITNYLWSNGSTNPTLNVTTSGTYKLTVFTADGFPGVSDSIVVTVSNLPVPNIGADVTVYQDCPGANYNLTTLYNVAGLTNTWNTVNPYLATAGVYRVVGKNAGGCTDTAFATVVLEVATWTGAVSNNWHTPGNWNINKVPTDFTHVIVGTSTPNPCVVSTANINAASIQIRNGAIVNVLNNRVATIGGRCVTLPPN